MMRAQCAPDVAVAIRGDGELGAQNALARVSASLLHHSTALGVHRTPPDARPAPVQRNVLCSQKINVALNACHQPLPILICMLPLRRFPPLSLAQPTWGPYLRELV